MVELVRVVSSVDGQELMLWGDRRGGFWVENGDGTLSPVMTPRTVTGNPTNGIEWLHYRGWEWRVRDVWVRSGAV